MDDLRALAKLITDAVKQIDESCTERGVAFPALDEPFSPQSEAARLHPVVLQASANIIAAAAQLTAIVRPPPLTLMTVSTQFHVPAALRVLVESNVVEILRSSGRKGMHVNKIAELANVNASKLARSLRLLAAEHIVFEVAPDVFANTRISSVLDTGKDITEILSDPDEKYTGTSCAGALVSHFTHHVFKSSAYFPDTFFDPAFANSTHIAKTPFNKAFRTDLPIFEWFEQPENKEDLKLFSLAFEGGTNMSPPDVILNGLSWATIPESSIIVDVGGGVGSQTMLLAKAHPHLKYIVQDRAPTVAQAQQFWKERHPEAVDSGNVTFQAHDFFEPQPVTNAAIFFMRMILHDWADEECVQILKSLRVAAKPDTRLLIIDMILSYASPPDANSEVSKHLQDIPGNSVVRPPPPLLPNAGHASVFGYLCDLQMMTVLNGQERTLAQLDAILTASGWKIAEVFPTPYFAAAHQQVVAMPA